MEITAEARRKADRQEAARNGLPVDRAAGIEVGTTPQGNSYAHTSRVRSILITESPTAPQDYKAMYQAGLAMLDESGRQPLDRY